MLIIVLNLQNRKKHLLPIVMLEPAVVKVKFYMLDVAENFTSIGDSSSLEKLLVKL